MPRTQSADWLLEAAAIGEQLRERTHRAVDGSPVWLKPRSVWPAPERPAPLGPHLYNGSTGIALFLAALGHVLDDDAYRELAFASLTPVRRHLAALAADPAVDQRQLRLGGVVGLGAFLYAFSHLGVWLDRAELLEEACRIAALLSPQRMAADADCELMYGSAGALLGLLLLEREAPAEWSAGAALLQRAVACGEDLLHRRTARNGSPRAWPYKGQEPIAGFAHGASGIACALERLAARTGRDEFRQAALEGLAYERRCYCPEHRNWRAEIPAGTAASQAQPVPPPMVAWCNGAPGIALGRLQILGAGDTEQTWDELWRALETTRHPGQPSPSDFLCCGAMGRAEILFEASCRLGREDLLGAAQEIAADVVARVAGRWFDPGLDGSNPGFFRGAAGMGYTLLRLAGVKPLPCVLALE
ncbi:MAG TPA: lanthionine synthetase LanC family protein [Thermoanaerobaculia bacterium]